MANFIIGLLLTLGSFQLSSSGVIQNDSFVVSEAHYERLFRSYQQHKAIKHLQPGGSILLARTWVGVRHLRPKLIALYIAPNGQSKDLDPWMFQSNLAFLLEEEIAILTYVDDTLNVTGLPKTLFE